MAKLQFTPYNTSPLPSSVVGTPGADQSGLTAAQSELTDAGSVASTELAAQNRAANVENSIAGYNVHQARSGINAYEAAQAQAARELARHEAAMKKEAAKAVADDIASGYQLQAAKAVKDIFEDPEIKRNPDKAPDKVAQKLADLYSNLPEMDQEVGALVHAKYNDTRVESGKAAVNYQFEQRKKNAEVAVVNADNRRVDYGVEATQGDVTQLKGLVQQVDQGMDGRINAQGPELAQKTATANKENIGKKFLLQAVTNAPNMMPTYLDDPVIKEIVPEDERNKFDVQAKARIKAITLEANKAQRDLLDKQENQRYNLYAQALTSRDTNVITNQIGMFKIQLDSLTKDTSGDPDVKRQAKDLTGWISSLQARIDYFESQARTQSNFERAQKNQKEQHDKTLAVLRGKEEHLKAVEHLTTLESGASRAKADRAYYDVRGKGSEKIITSTGTDAEKEKIKAAIKEQQRAFEAGDLGVKTEESTAKLLNERTSYLQQRLDLNDAKQKRRHDQDANSPWSQVIHFLQAQINQHEAANPPLSDKTKQILNPTNDPAKDHQLDVDWEKSHRKYLDDYRKSRNMAPDAPISMKLLHSLRVINEANMVVGKK